ncbi:MAG: ParB/RepB/Spo0J family partition protein [Thermoguttaceae bacterium]
MSKTKRLGRGLDSLLSSLAAANEANEDVATKSSSNSNATDPPYPSILAIDQTEVASPTVATQGARQSDAAALEEQKDRALASFSDGRLATEISIDLIDANPYQPRLDFDEAELEELKESITQHGMLQPIVVRKTDDRYQIVAGERRFRAAQELGWEKAPSILIAVDERQMAELALTENIQRRDLNPIEKAAAFRSYLDLYGGTHEELASRLALDRSTVTNLMRLLDLNEEIQEMVRKGIISQGHARALLPLEEWDQKEMAQRIVAEKLSVRQTEAIVRAFLNSDDLPAPTEETKQAVNPRIQELEGQLRSWLGMKVKLTSNDKGKGKLVIQFNSNNDFERIYQAFMPRD